MQDVVGDGGVEPRHNALIDLGPLDVIEHHESINRPINMIEKTKLVEGEVEEGLPDAEVGLVEVEDDGDVVAYVDELDGGGTRSSRIDRASGKGVGPGGGEGGVGGGGEFAEVHGSSSVEDVAAVARFRRLGCSGSKARN